MGNMALSGLDNLEVVDLSNNVISSPNSKKDREPVPCQYCGKEFSNYFNMERHIRQACKVGRKTSF